jgi:hypothetical protein
VIFSQTARLLFACAFLGVAIPPPSAANDLDQPGNPAPEAHRAELAKLATWCDEQGLPEQAAITRNWLLPRSPRVRYVYLLPAAAGTLEPLADAPEKVAEWQRRFAKLRTERAEKLLELAKEALDQGRVVSAFELANEAARENPDHEELRRIFGYQKHAGGWHTPYAVSQMKAGRVWHEKFGWLPKANVARYEKGQRYSEGRWVSAAQDAANHRDIRKGWKIETDHFVITTNHSLQGGVQVGQRLERLHDAFQVLFAGYRLTKPQLTELFRTGGKLPPPGKKHAVTFYRDKADYRAALRGEIPDPDNLATSGVYLSAHRTAYFFHNDDPDDNTLSHEVTHQLFHESPRVAPNVGQRADFWMIEGIACYMESLIDQGGYLTLGGVDALRGQYARYYLVNHNQYTPLAELTRLGMTDVQRQPQLEQQKLYAQSAALVDFMMHADQGRYRDALVDYLTRIYQGRPTPLASILGAPLAEVDKLYRQFQQLDDGDLAILPRGERMTALALSGTRVTDAGLARLNSKIFKKLEWLDLYKTQVGDAGLAHLEGLAGLAQLNLSGTRITDAGLKRVAKLAQLKNLMLGATAISDDGLASIAGLDKLEQLVLWNTSLSDAGLAHLKGLRNLRQLELAGTRVSDEGLSRLAELPSLETLDLTGTSVTASGASRLQRSLPKLKITR